MHQHPRPSLSTGTSTSNEQARSSRTSSSKDKDGQSLRTRSVQGSGSSEDFASTKQDSAPDPNPSAQMQRLNQVIQNFHTKATLIVLQSRIDLPEAYSSKSNEKRVNRWFNIELDETDEYNDDIRRWRKCDVKSHRPPPLIIETYLATDALAQGQRLVVLDDEEKRWDVSNALASMNTTKDRRRTTNVNEILLERWTIELGEPTSPIPSDLTSILPLVYKKSIVLFRSLYTYCNFLPAWKLSRKVGKNRHNMAMKIGYRIFDGTRIQDLSRPDNLDLPLYDSTSDVTSTYNFGVTESPAGPFSVKVRYRENCDFRIDDTEELLSSRFIGADDDLFQPSIPREDQATEERERSRVGSLPTDARRHLRERPELGHAYGSMSTFHQAGTGTGMSPISALRNARELGQQSPSPEQARPLPQSYNTTGRVSARTSAGGRRNSTAFQPFKTPALSASPLGASPLAGSPRGSSARVPALGSLTEEGGLPLPNAQVVAARRSGSLASGETAPMSMPSSPKPAPTRYSSSFSHRRGRPSIDRTSNRGDDDQVSSGRGSASSSIAPPGSTLIAEATAGGVSSGSMQEDDENISDFLKLLDTKKDLLGQSDNTSNDAAARRTTTALNRFHKMRDTNAALSESMSSSFMLQKSSQSSSRQLTSVPPMIAATSVSTSSSPGKPISPHTPHTPFAPSRLSAAFSHDDGESQQQITIEEQQQQSLDDTSRSDDTTQAGPAAANVPAIDIPTSPRPLIPAFRRSSSAQRQPLPSDDDIGDLYGMRSASMGAPNRKSAPQLVSGRVDNDTDENIDAQEAAALQRLTQSFRIPTSTNSDSESYRSPARNVYRSRLSRGNTLRGTSTTTPPQGSTSSFGGTGGSIDREGESGGSNSGSYMRGGRFRSGSRIDKPENRVAVDDDDFLPFAMEKSDFQSVTKKGTDHE